jgi:hypothetical protein
MAKRGDELVASLLLGHLPIERPLRALVKTSETNLVDV